MRLNISVEWSDVTSVHSHTDYDIGWATVCPIGAEFAGRDGAPSTVVRVYRTVEQLGDGHTEPLEYEQTWTLFELLRQINNHRHDRVVAQITATLKREGTVHTDASFLAEGVGSMRVRCEWA